MSLRILIMFAALLESVLLLPRLDGISDGNEPDISYCPPGCTHCSTWNGCTQCAQNYTWHLEQKYLRTMGICLVDCPSGYFKKKIRHSQGAWRCAECKANHCEKCSDRDFCDICRRPYLESKGQCIIECPAGLYHSSYRSDCYEQVDCVLGSWSEWSQCERDGKTCGRKWGNQTRTRSLLQQPSPNGDKCSAKFEDRRCKLVQRYCNINNSVKANKDAEQRRRLKKRKRRRRCKLLKKAGKKCSKRDKNKDDIALNIRPINLVNPNTGRQSLMNSSNYFNYYQQTAELLQLLKLSGKKRD